MEAEKYIRNTPSVADEMQSQVQSMKPLGVSVIKPTIVV